MIHLKLTIMALLWAGGFIAAKQIAHQAGPFTIAFLRFFVATFVFAVLVYRKGQFAKINARLLVYVVCAAFFGQFCYNYFFFAGIQHIDAGRGAAIISTVPIVVLIISYLIFKEKVSASKSLGVLLSLVGAWVVVSKGQITAVMFDVVGRGEMYLIFCVFFAAAFTLISKPILKQLSPMVAMLIISVFGTVFLFIPAVIETSKIPVQFGSYSFLLNLLYLSVGPSVIAVTFYYDAIRQVGPARASQYMNLIPVFAVLLAFVFLGEQLTATLFVGGSFVTTGLWLTNITT